MPWTVRRSASISVVEPALPPLEPFKPKVLLNIILSLLLGAFASIGLAFALEYFSHTFNRPEDVEQYDPCGCWQQFGQ